jgi:uncharacterized protein with FMN-binding domain
MVMVMPMVMGMVVGVVVVVVIGHRQKVQHTPSGTVSQPRRNTHHKYQSGTYA